MSDLNRPLIRALGILLVLAGVMILPFSFKIEKKAIADYQEVRDAWSVSKSFEEGSYLGISFRPHNDWSLPRVEIAIEIPPESGNIYGGPGTGADGVKLFTVNVTNPDGNYSTFDIYLIITKLYAGASAVTVFPDYFPPPLPDKGGVIVDEGYPKIEYVEGEYVIVLGRTPVQGEYHINCIVLGGGLVDLVEDRYITNGSVWYHPHSPPPILRLYEVKGYQTYFSSLNLLPVAGTVLSAGLIAIILSYRKEEEKRERQIVKSSRRLKIHRHRG